MAKYRCFEIKLFPANVKKRIAAQSCFRAKRRNKATWRQQKLTSVCAASASTLRAIASLAKHNDRVMQGLISRDDCHDWINGCRKSTGCAHGATRRRWTEIISERRSHSAPAHNV
jgi:hypothetical protein